MCGKARGSDPNVCLEKMERSQTKESNYKLNRDGARSRIAAAHEHGVFPAATVF
jgi:hypothetical protein